MSDSVVPQCVFHEPINKELHLMVEKNRSVDYSMSGKLRPWTQFNYDVRVTRPDRDFIQ